MFVFVAFIHILFTRLLKYRTSNVHRSRIART